MLSRSFQTNQNDLTVAYKGYLVIYAPIHKEYYIRKDNAHIATCNSLADAKASIDLIA